MEIGNKRTYFEDHRHPFLLEKLTVLPIAKREVLKPWPQHMKRLCDTPIWVCNRDGKRVYMLVEGQNSRLR